MTTIRYIHWQDGDMWLGYFEDYPDYLTQGDSLEDLQAHLKDLYEDLTGGYIPGVRKVAELQNRMKRTDLIRQIDPTMKPSY